VANRKKNQKKPHPKPAQNKTGTTNRFEALSNLSEEAPPVSLEKSKPPPQKEPLSGPVLNSPPVTLDLREEEVEEMEIGDLDLDAIEEAMADKDKGYVPTDQVRLLEEAILMSNPPYPMGIEIRT